MSVAPSTERLLDVIDVASRQLFVAALNTGAAAPVPTCPGWQVRHLVAHTGMVHRWARAMVLGGEAPFSRETDVLAAIHHWDLPAWMLDGAADLVTTLRTAPADLAAWVFMETTRTPREFWIRRQAHETTLHAVDAFLAGGGHATASSLGEFGGVLTADFAVDGVDELLTGFAPRGGRKLYEAGPQVVAVRTTDTDGAWTLRLAADALTVTGGLPERYDAMWSGTAVGLYLGLWNRGDEVTVDGDSATLDRWRERIRVR